MSSCLHNISVFLGVALWVWMNQKHLQVLHSQPIKKCNLLTNWDRCCCELIQNLTPYYLLFILLMQSYGKTQHWPSISVAADAGDALWPKLTMLQSSTEGAVDLRLLYKLPRKLKLETEIPARRPTDWGCRGLTTNLRFHTNKFRPVV